MSQKWRIPDEEGGDREAYCMFCMSTGIHVLTYEEDGSEHEAVYDCLRCLHAEED